MFPSKGKLNWKQTKKREILPALSLTTTEAQIGSQFATCAVEDYADTASLSAILVFPSEGHFILLFRYFIFFYAPSQNYDKRLLASSYPSVRPHETPRLPLGEF
jgi:hypothetical protein